VRFLGPDSGWRGLGWFLLGLFARLESGVGLARPSRGRPDQLPSRQPLALAAPARPAGAWEGASTAVCWPLLGLSDLGSGLAGFQLIRRNLQAPQSGAALRLNSPEDHGLLRSAEFQAGRGWIRRRRTPLINRRPWSSL